MFLSALSRVMGYDLEAAVAAASRSGSRVHKIRIVCLLVTLVCVWTAQVYSRSFAIVLAQEHPVVLLALDARLHNMVLVADTLPQVVLLVTSMVSRFTEHLLYFFLGRWTGESALRTVRQRSGWLARLVRRAEQAFARSGNMAVLILSDRPVAVLAGAALMSPARFVALHLPGTALRVWAATMLARSSQTVVKPWIAQLEAHTTFATITLLATSVLWISVLAVGVKRHNHRSSGMSEGDE
ncbi:hypothetical protein [Pedococcus sp. 5OH_020]|uniref:hypothetical protein n=1 Tax=Pedococcus sp. 5OH_020 TaxID=2989814 RepID=UPI0022E9E990|nr:hypothetical protein [Pedococcus sp. 5OH_020]